MQIFFVYLLKVIIYSGILFGYYLIALRNKRFHYYNRFYLLMSVLLSLLLPLLQLQIWQWKSSNPQVITLANIIVTNASEHEKTARSLSLSFADFLLLAYLVIAACLLLSFAAGLVKLLRIKKKYPSEKLGDILFINTDLPQAPFSFFKNLFWKNTLDISDETGKQIFRHELAHIEQKHSSDKFFLQVVTLLFWLNPFYWLIQKELSLIHEFIADEKAIDNKDSEAFALMLLQSQFGKNSFLPMQSFSYSPIKRRLHMLTSLSKTSHSYARRILALPVLSLTVLLFAFRLSNDHQSLSLSHTNTPFTLVIDAGHGGSENGAVGIADAMEKNINLSIAKKVEELAPQYGITVKMTRTEDATVSMEDRMNIIKSTRPDACISIHVNGAPGEQTSKEAFQVYITKNNTGDNYKQSRLLGSSLLQSVKTNFPVDADIMQRKQGIYVLDQNPYPAVIIECGYMTNENSMQNLTTDAGIESIAKDILQGVVSYANRKGETTSLLSSDTTGKLPLYIIDGKEVSAEEMKKVDSKQIASINVLKDKEAVEKYGKKGENGVVVIATKSQEHIEARDKKEFTGIYIIDGKETSKDQLGALGPDDIVSINVLKGDEATKIYGEKGAKGVIVITTKKLQTEKGSTSYLQSTGKERKDEVPNTGSASDQIKSFAPPIAIMELGDESNRERDANDSESYDKVFTSTQLSAAFPGGREAWLSYFGKHLNSGVVKKGAKGTYTVNVQFTIDDDGQITDVKALNNPGYGSAEEAVRVIKSSPVWAPAVQNGIKVPSRMKQAVIFYNI